MHLYWRVLEELKFLGESWQINDPSLLRCYKSWTQKHYNAINLDFSRGLRISPALSGQAELHN
jgi:hypothetical protein